MGSSLKQHLRLTSITLLFLTALKTTVAGVLFTIDTWQAGFWIAILFRDTFAHILFYNQPQFISRGATPIHL